MNVSDLRQGQAPQCARISAPRWPCLLCLLTGLLLAFSAGFGPRTGMSVRVAAAQGIAEANALRESVRSLRLAGRAQTCRCCALVCARVWARLPALLGAKFIPQLFQRRLRADHAPRAPPFGFLFRRF